MAADREALIIGYGVVGKRIYTAISTLNPDIYDKYKKMNSSGKVWVHKDGKLIRIQSMYKIAFICVDTPRADNGIDLDISEVRNSIVDNSAEIYVIKSTVPIGTIDRLKKETGKRIVYSPEYYGNTPHSTGIDFNFTILGGSKQDCIEVQQILQKCVSANHRFKLVDSQTAELAKLMENSWLATKVSFCTQFYNIAEAHGISYEELRELFIMDPRVNPSHTFVYRESPYWNSHCLNKDVLHIANSEECASLLRDIISYNNDQVCRHLREGYNGKDSD